MTPLVVPLAPDTPRDVGLGGKGRGLVDVLRQGLPVPRALGVTTAAFEAFTAASPGYDEDLAALAAAPDPDSRAAVATALRARLQATPVPPSMTEALQALLPTLGPGLLAVRSSAAAEDLAHASFAGQHDSFLDVLPEDVPARIRDCWCSLFSDRAVAYRFQRGLGTGELAMAVVVQQMVPARVAGVVFTADPSGTPDRVLVEAVPGLGEALVGGHAGGERWILSGDGAGVHERPAAPAAPEVVVQAAAGQAVILATRQHRPLDVEWAWDGAQTWVLQARPLTTLADPRDLTAWTNMNTAEVIPGVLSPLFAHLVEQILQPPLRRILAGLGVDVGDEPFIGFVAGRVYFNMHLMAGLGQSLPWMRSALDPDAVLGGAHLDRDVIREAFQRRPPPRFRVSRLRLLLGIPRTLLWALRSGPTRGERHLEDFRDATARIARRDPASLPPGELSTAVRASVALLDRFPGLVGYQFIGMVHHNLLALACRRWLPGMEGLPAALLVGWGDVESAEVGLEIQGLAAHARAHPAVRELLERRDLEPSHLWSALAGVPGGGAFNTAFDGFLTRHGHRSRNELDPMTPRWAEDPRLVLDAILAAADSPVDPAAERDRRVQARQAAVARCRARLGPVRRRLFDGLLALALQGARLRERTKSDGVRAVVAIRRLCLEVGRRGVADGTLGAADDPFFLDLEAVARLAAGDTLPGVGDTVATRRRAWTANAALAPPPVVVGRYDPSRELPPLPPAGPRLRGMAASAGVVEGVARVLLDPFGSDRLRPGEILVAPATDPGWTPALVNAAGIVTDIGGLLSHGSIIARELGIPAVVNAGPATRSIRTGQRVRVDGTRGEVVVLDSREAASTGARGV